ncbi:TPA: type III-B CRISPR module RAMP protein Cmr6 [Vibrio cholerae]|uniref:type III-B CRISPR module RAMP protein Cmr6 n=2 Tax=Vibrio cholerae TaxID=666 RepID=UPI0010FE489C|nr:type III-B CRISPR module RAMP protein Cmr6 [Vibrio cholerae]EGR2439865.1 type III-B CRISPR module RAMP protein Cmr6 [Vibrio cholerae]TLE21011.1 type III-B CRISPR module RAMP protein Cmr6 [Vibrio cholerae]TLE28006.1 type III-B CRISPR module RAMP protein Cmr6 [Vibrio cholerae]TLE30833.1 type III-B CRISPR module RAMP protein Cmr6 [Vibrio cholerae]TLE43078.1 type III-B CRISPR module RAMP protein Cmr6 [Vibrio cholerae]
MTALVRNKIQSAFCQRDSANPSLLLQKGLLEANQKTGHLEEIVKLPASSEYKNAFNRWFDLTSDVNGFQQSVMMLENRLLIGLTGNGALETGCSLSRNYGMPYIPGSSVKGVVRAWASGKTLSNVAKATLDDLLGTYDSEQPNRVAGTVTFHDAWWIPAEGAKPFVLDVVTTHHQEYYNGKKAEPSDKDGPIPNHLLAVQGSFLFVIEGDPEHIKLCQSMLNKALESNGIGAKTAAGYGYCKDNTELLERLIDDSLKRPNLTSKIRAQREAQKQKAVEEEWSKGISQLTENKLIQMFSKDLKKTQERDDLQDLIEKVKQHHCEVIESWKNETKDSSKNRYKAYQFLKGEQE